MYRLLEACGVVMPGRVFGMKSSNNYPYSLYAAYLPLLVCAARKKVVCAFESSICVATGQSIRFRASLIATKCLKMI